MKNMKQLLFLLLISLIAFGCSDERLIQPMEGVFFDGGEGNGVAPQGTLGPPPPEIQELLWDNENVLLRNAQQKYYTKYINAGGIAIIGDNSIGDRFFWAGRDIILTMTSKHPEIREVLSAEKKFRMILVSPPLGLVSIPEVDIDFVINDTHGIGFCGRGISRNYFCAQTVQEHPLPDKDDLVMDAFVHEFAHAMHHAIHNDIAPTFQERLEEAYTNALETGGVWGHGSYGLENVQEYWAVGVQKWFWKVTKTETPEFHAHFLEKDPLLYDLLDEWLPFVYLRPVEWKW